MQVFLILLLLSPALYLILKIPYLEKDTMKKNNRYIVFSETLRSTGYYIYKKNTVSKFKVWYLADESFKQDIPIEEKLESALLTDYTGTLEQLRELTNKKVLFVRSKEGSR